MPTHHDDPRDAYRTHLQRALDSQVAVTDGGSDEGSDTSERASDVTLATLLETPSELEHRLGSVLGTVEVAPGIPACEITQVTRESLTVIGVYAPRDGGVSPARVWKLANHEACVSYEGVTTVREERVPELLLFEQTRTFESPVESVKELQQELKSVFGCGISL